MRIALFYPVADLASWNLGLGIEYTLRCDMAHEVRAAGYDVKNKVSPLAFQKFKRDFPTVEELKQVDLILVSGMEYFTGWIKAVYGEEWFKIKTPKAAWVHESNERDDVNFTFSLIQKYADHWFYPSIADAEKLHGNWLPFGFDSSMFWKREWLKLYDIAFIGWMYPKREEFMRSLAPKLGGLNIKLANVRVDDLSGYNVLESTKLYAINICQVKIFVNLPSMSKLTVLKVYEVMGCGTCLVTPVPQGDQRNANASNVFYYNNADHLAGILHSLSNDDSTVEDQARRGYEEARSKHTLAMRLHELLTKIGATDDNRTEHVDRGNAPQEAEDKTVA